jgi:hypothetical protein
VKLVRNLRRLPLFTQNERVIVALYPSTVFTLDRRGAS